MRPAWGLALGALLLTAAGCAADVVPPPAGKSELPIISGEREYGMDAVIGLLRPDSTGLTLRCSASLIAPRVVLTAKHCVFDRTGSSYVPSELVNMYFAAGHDLSQPDRIRDPITPHRVITTPGADIPSDLFTGDDIALVLLREEMLVEPIPVAVRAPGFGDPILIAGFGRRLSGPSVPGDYGRKHVGMATVSVVYDGTFGTTGESWLCHGDSGGPAINDSGQVAGINSFVTTSQCDDMFGGYTEVSRHTALLVEALTAEQPCFPREEECDGRDNDCNGVRDDGCFRDGEPCVDPAQCMSARCEAVGAESFCTRACDPGLAAGCATGLFCEGDACGEGRCVPAELAPAGGRPCRDGAARCASGEVCDTADGRCGSCTPIADASGLRVFGDPCDTAEQCGSGLCDAGICTRSCGSEGCPDGAHCREGLCVLGELAEAGGDCAVDDDCDPTAPSCVADGERLCAAGCGAGGACPDDFVCAGAAGGDYCLPEGAALGETCSAPGDCRSGLCRERCTRACGEAAFCPAGFACREGYCARSGGCSAAGGPAALGALAWLVSMVLGGCLRRRGR